MILNPVDLLNQASDYTTELTWSSNIQKATFFYLKTPTSNLNSNKAEDWGSALGTGKVETSALRWTTTNVDGLYWGNVENSFDVTNSMISAWPATHGTYVAEKDGYVLTRDGDHWNSIFEAYKDSVEKKLGITDLQKSDITDIILKPFKVSRFNKTDESYHVDCKVEVKCTQVVTATFNVKDVNDDDYVQVKAENYKSGSQVNFPSYSPEKAGHKFSGWYFDRNLSEKVEDNYTIGNENVDFYAKYTPKTYTVTWKNGSTLLEKDEDVAHNTQPSYRGATPTKEGNDQYNYKFIGWSEDADATTGVAVEELSAVTKDVTYYAVFEKVAKTYTVTWMNGNDQLEQDKDVAHNTQPSYRGATPTKEGNDQYNYKFIGWSEDADATTGVAVEELSAVTKDVTYYAVFEKVAKTYTVIFDANGGAWAENVTIPDYNINEGTRDKATRENLTASDTIKSISYPTKNGATMIGWGTQNGQPLYQLGLGRGVAVSNLKSLNDVSVTGNTITLYAIWQNVSIDQCTYTIHQHFMKDASHEDGAINYYTTSQVASVGTSISSLIPNSLINKETRYKFRYSEYLYGEAKIGTTPYKGTETLQANNTAIHLYYYLDEVGETSKENPDGGPDGIPDAWQYKVTFQVVNGSWNDKTNAAIVKYVTKKDAEGNNSATGTAKLDTVPEVGKEPNSGYEASGNWDPTLSTDLEITKDTVFTYTYDQKSGGGGGSGGSSRPSTPTVTIPDDVPTGLNGKDHYAYIIGYGNNDVRPQNNITRAEVATIFFRLLTDETREANMTKSNGYNDVKDGDWFCCAVSTLSKMGIIKGYEDGSFKPNDPISRAEFAAIAARFDPDGDKTPATFADVTSHWAKDEISIAANHGWIKGYEDGSFKPDQKITRAETMTLVNRVLNRLPETKDDLHKDMKTWVDNMDETAWYYLDVQEATNSHYFKNKTGTKFEQWTELRDTRDWSELEK